jgi:hypothetical protein
LQVVQPHLIVEVPMQAMECGLTDIVRDASLLVEFLLRSAKEINSFVFMMILGGSVGVLWCLGGSTSFERLGHAWGLF